MPATSVCVAVLHLRLVEHGARVDARSHEGNPKDLELEAERWIEPFAVVMRLSRRDSGKAVRIIVSQRRFTQTKKGKSPLLFARSEEFQDALDLSRLRSMAWGQGWDVYEAWRDRHAEALSASPEEVERERKRGRRRGRRRRGKRTEGPSDAASTPASGDDA